MDFLFDQNTKEGFIKLKKIDEHILNLIINDRAFAIEGYPKNMIQASYSVLKRKDENLIQPFVMSNHSGQISHLVGKDIFIFTIGGNEASLEGDELELLMIIIDNFFCV